MTLLERDREKLEEGRAEGIKEGKMKSAENLLKIGMSEDTISTVTELSIDEIREMKKKMMH